MSLINQIAGTTNILAYASIKTDQSCPEPGESNKAIDGEKYDDWHCTKIQRREKPWWGVFLEGFYIISEVIIQKRHKCCSKYHGRILNDYLEILKTYENLGKE